MNRRRAFTLIEMLVVIGVIALLVTIGVLAYGHVANAIATKSTHTTLGIAQGFLAEYDAGPGLARLGVSRDPNPNNAPPVPFPYPGGKVAGDPTQPIGLSSLIPTGDLSEKGNYLPIPGDQTSPPKNAVYWTMYVDLTLSQIPAVQSAVQKLPRKELLTDINGNALQFNNGRQLTTFVLLDSWGHPVIFVPAGGLLTKINTGDNTPQPHHFLIRTSGSIDLGQADSPIPPLKPGDRPFFASAGPDANFDSGDDNLYSFQQ